MSVFCTFTDIPNNRQLASANQGDNLHKLAKANQDPPAHVFPPPLIIHPIFSFSRQKYPFPTHSPFMQLTPCEINKNFSQTFIGDVYTL